MPDELTTSVTRLLRKVGTSDRMIARCTLDTRLYHDLNVYGDVALDHLHVLATEFGVNLSEFEFDRYFPQEFYGDTVFQQHLFAYLPFLRWLFGKKRTYEPITLRMVDEAIERKAWVPQPETVVIHRST